MARIVRMEIDRRIYKGEVDISADARIIAVDEEQDQFKEYYEYYIDLDKITDDEFERLLNEIQNCKSLSRKRLERARELSRKYNIPLEERNKFLDDP
ncbi:MAG: hypothetical protein QXO72_04245 [Sulfolobales archaeon]